MLIWVILVSIIASMIIQSDINSAEDKFHHSANRLYQLVNEKVHTNETVLEGFAATVSAIGKLDRRKIRTFSRQMLERYSQIFMFEIADRIEHHDKQRFVSEFREKVWPDFAIRKFDYDSERSWSDVEPKAFYIPIIFMEPFPNASQKVLGLDLMASKVSATALQNATASQSATTTIPFQLVEGNLAYLIVKPIITHSTATKSTTYSDRYVILVIQANSLLNSQTKKMHEITVTLYHDHFEIGDQTGHLYHQPADTKSRLESILFPNFYFSKTVNSKAQPFTICIEQQIGFNALDWWLLIALMMVSSIAFYVLLYFAKVYHQMQISRYHENDELFYMANHDSLTGLANRNLMNDRLEHAIVQANRNNTRLAVLFLDFNDFKLVNDRHGHAIGDKLLRRSSERLLVCIRRGDTLARRSGDEFIIILENIELTENVELIQQKIHAAFDREFNIDGIVINIGISIGNAIFPDDAEEKEELLDIADKRMYQNKAHK